MPDCTEDIIIAAAEIGETELPIHPAGLHLTSTEPTYNTFPRDSPLPTFLPRMPGTEEQGATMVALLFGVFKEAVSDDDSGVIDL